MASTSIETWASVTSLLGQSRRFDPLPVTSGLPPPTDINGPAPVVRFVPNSGPHPNSIGQRPSACARKVGCDTVTARVSDNRLMSSPSKALVRSFVEVRHVFRQHCVQFNQQSRSSFTMVSGPEMVQENPARVAGQNRTGVGTAVPAPATSQT